jgi:hypothetical protein
MPMGVLGVLLPLALVSFSGVNGRLREGPEDWTTPTEDGNTGREDFGGVLAGSAVSAIWVFCVAGGFPCSE